MCDRIFRFLDNIRYQISGDCQYRFFYRPDIPGTGNLRSGDRPERGDGDGDGEHAVEGEGEREGVQTDEELTPTSWGSSTTAGVAGGGRIELGGLGRVRTVSRTIPSAPGLPARFHVR